MAGAAPALVLLTYNVWFADLLFDVRAKALFATLEQSDADVICLQEVLPRFGALLSRQPWVAQRYTVSSGGADSGSLDADAIAASVAPYGVLTLVKKEWQPSFSYHVMPTNMARRLLVAELRGGAAAEHPVAIGNVHLESLDSHPTREQQLRVAERALSRWPSSVLAGDFNFCSYRNFRPGGRLENDSLRRLLPTHRDVWPLLRHHGGDACRLDAASATAPPPPPGEEGWTFDSDANGVIQQFEQMRYDRVMLRGAAWAASRIELLGTDPIAGVELPAELRGGQLRNKRGVEGVWRSDHFGLLARLALDREAAAAAAAGEWSCAVQ